MESEMASPLPEGRADGRADVALLESILGSVWLHGKWHYLTRQMTTEQKERFADAVDRSAFDPDYDEPGRTVADRWWRDDAAPAVPVGVQPEPAEEACSALGCQVFGPQVSHGHAPAVPVVHPEPASESSDSVAELVADTTRSGDRALGLDGYTYVSAECDDHQHAGCPRPDECACHCHEDRSAKWRAGLDEAVIPVRVRKAMALADAEVAAAVAAVRADLADQIEAVQILEPQLDDVAKGYNQGVRHAAALIRGRS